MVWRAAHADMHVVAPLRIVVRCDVVAQGRVVNCSCHDHDDVARRRARWVCVCARASAPSAVQRSLLFLTLLPLSLLSPLSLSCLHLLLCKLYLLLLLHLHLVEKFTAYQKVVEACLSNAATGWDV